MVNLNHKKQNGVSLIALVITIIVVIILAAIAFNSSTSTISKANYSKFVANLSEVQDAVTTKGVTEKGLAAANGNQVTDAQAYNYIAKGGTTEADFLPNSQVPEYTMIADNADIGIELPVIKVNTKDETGVKVKFGVTQDGTVFIWPPYLYEEEYYVTATDTVTTENAEGTGDIAIKVGKTDITLKIDENGKLEGTTEAGSAGALTEEDKANLQNLSVGQYVAYNPSTENSIEIDYTKILDDKYTVDLEKTKYTLTSTETKWKILDINKETGEILITTDGTESILEDGADKGGIRLGGVKGYKNGSSTIDEVCKALYSANGLTARGLTVEEMNRICNFNITDADELVKNLYSLEGGSTDGVTGRYAYYPIGTDLSKLVDNGDITVNGKTYKGTVCSSSLYNGYTEPRFYKWDSYSKTATERDDAGYEYAYPYVIEGTPKAVATDAPQEPEEDNNEYVPVLVSWDVPVYVMPEDIQGVVGTSTRWLASSCVNVGPENALFFVCVLYSGSVYARDMCYSDGGSGDYAVGVVPVVSLSSKLINFSDTSKDGSEPETAWELK